MSTNKHPFDLEVEKFLQQYWQKQPLFLPDAFSNIPHTNSHELIDLACNEQVFSRVVLTPEDLRSWQMEYGPFHMESIELFQKKKWTLLINGINHFIPHYAKLLDYFRFIPNWRIDDVMLSYSNLGSGVGPHVDNYDVFLLQAHGEKTWHLDLNPKKDLLENLHVKILKHFSNDITWHASPGDLIYLPPGIGHHGIADSNDCVTISIGFRMPRIKDLIGHYYQYHAELIQEQFLDDKDLSLQAHCGEITPSSITKIFDAIKNISPSEEICKNWFGEFITDADTEWLAEELSLDQFTEKLNTDALIRNEDCRFAFRKLGNGIHLYINGETFTVRAPLDALAILLCDERELILDPNTLDKAAKEFVFDLYQRAYLIFESQLSN